MAGFEYDAKIDGVKLMRRATMHVKLHRARELQLRLWLAIQVIRFAVWIANMGIEIEDDPKA